MPERVCHRQSVKEVRTSGSMLVRGAAREREREGQAQSVSVCQSQEGGDMGEQTAHIAFQCQSVPFAV
jgi:hypothetical protein